MSTLTCEPSLAPAALDVLRRVGNPFRNYFARNPDDEVCARFHVAELYARERSQLLSVVDLYRATPGTHCGDRAGAGQQGGRQDAPAALDQAWPATGPGSCSSRPAPIRRTPIFSNTCSFRSSTRCWAAASSGPPAARILQRGAGPGAAAASAATWPARRGSSTCSRPPGLALGPQARPWQLAGAGTDAMAARQPDAADAGQRLRSAARICADNHLAEDRACEFVCRFIERTAAHNTAGPDAPPHLPGPGPGRPARR